MATISGGSKLISALDGIAKSVTKAATLKVGFLEGSIAPNGQSMPLRAALNEFGTSRMPPRPFFRSMVAAKSGEWPSAIGNLLVANNYDAQKTLDQTGVAIKEQLQQSIRDLVSPPLAESTVRKKGFDKPLIEHDDMLRTVSYQVD